MSTDSRDNRKNIGNNGGEGVETDDSQDSGKLGPKEYLGHRVLKEREKNGGQPISRSVFWKLCCLADRQLKDEYNLDIEFPRHWYKYGEVGEAHSLSRDFFQAPKARFWQGQEYHSKEIPETEFDVEKDNRRLIRQAAIDVVEEYHEEDAQGLKEVQYRHHAPNNFIKTYSYLRRHLEKLDEHEPEGVQQSGLDDFMEDQERAHVEKILDKMINEYPREQYSDVYRLYLRWDDTMRMLVEQKRSAHEQKVFLELFVEKLSEITLRFEHNNGIPEGRIKDWYAKRDEKIETLNEGIENIRKECLNRRERSGELASISDIYDEVILEKI